MRRWNRVVIFRHALHFTALCAARRRVGLSEYVTRPNNFRHMNKEVKNGVQIR